MKVSEIVSILDCQVVTCKDCLDLQVRAACGCDLMSDVLTFIKPEALLLTGLSNPQAIRTAEISEVKVVCFVRGKQPTPDMIQLANDKGIALLTTHLPLFEACGKLYAKGLRGLSESGD